MCRIAGIASFTNSQENNRKVNSMISSMAHGGPDDEGVYQHGNVTLGHRRLSIIDLSPSGHQPMVHHSGSLVVCYNGEIYNYKELRAELKSNGVSFRTSTDTEVILEAYRAWGTKSFGRLRGIFAFALLDIHASKMMLVRDSPGVKPLYYKVSPDGVVFASEVKAFRQYDAALEENADWKALFLAFGYIPHPITTLKGVIALTPGSYLEIGLGDLRVAEFSYTQQSLTSGIVGNSNAIDNVRQSVLTALQRNIISDAPLGVFLSGGIDSSLLALLAAKEIGENERTVSVNFEEATFDESPYQNMVLDRIRNKNHLKYVVNEEMFWNSFDEIWRAMDQPTIDGVNSFFVSKAARQAGLKAVLSGLGADELFGGYASSSRANWLKYLRSLPAKDMIAGGAGMLNNSYRRIAFLKLQNQVGDYLFLRGIHAPASIATILDGDEREVWRILGSVSGPANSEIPSSSYANFLEFNFYMRSQLLKDTDFMSMWFGLETRVPFLDQDLIRTAASVGSNSNNSQPKFLLTRAFEDVIPREIIFRKKHGFTFPFHVWLSNRLRSGERVMNEHLSRVLPVDRFLAGKAHWSQLWSGVVLDHFKQV